MSHFQLKASITLIVASTAVVVVDVVAADVAFHDIGRQCQQPTRHNLRQIGFCVKVLLEYFYFMS